MGEGKEGAKQRRRVGIAISGWLSSDPGWGSALAIKVMRLRPPWMSICDRAVRGWRGVGAHDLTVLRTSALLWVTIWEGVSGGRHDVEDISNECSRKLTMPWKSII